MKNIRNPLLFLCLLFTASPAFADPLRVALVLDRGGKDDKSFNSAAFEGCRRAEKELGISLKYVETADDAAVETVMRSFAQKKMDLIIGIGFAQAEALKKVAAQNPQVHFAIVDADVAAPNVRSLMFEEQEGSYLMGVIAALKTKGTKIGFIGGMDVPLIRRFEMGYEAGMKKINPKATLVSNYIGITGDSWNNPAKSKELALSQYNSGVDVIFTAAGASNNGVFDAAEEKKKLAIGVDSNQNWVKPGFILTSMLKRVDLAVFEVIKNSNEGKFSAGTLRFNLKNSGVDYALDEYNKNLLSPEILKKTNELKAQIVAGKISVPDYYKKKR